VNKQRVKENIRLLDLAIAWEIETDRAARRATQFRSELELSLMKNPSLLGMAVAAELEAKRMARKAKLVREELEREIWRNQEKINPNFKLPLAALTIGTLATSRIPKNITQLGQLCQRCSIVDLCPTGTDKGPAHEIKDLLRTLGLVLRPKEL